MYFNKISYKVELNTHDKKKIKEFSVSLFLIFGCMIRGMACRTLIPSTRDQTLTPCIEVQSLKHWTAGEVPVSVSLGFTFLWSLMLG